MSNSHKTLIYKIVCNNLDVLECYVGSTTDFKSRKYAHKTSCNNEFSKAYNLKVYKFIRENGGWDNFTMVLIEEYFCGSKLECRSRERFWFENLNSGLNTNYPQRSKAEYPSQYVYFKPK